MYMSGLFLVLCSLPIGAIGVTFLVMLSQAGTFTGEIGPGPFEYAIGVGGTVIGGGLFITGLIRMILRR